MLVRLKKIWTSQRLHLGKYFIKVSNFLDVDEHDFVVWVSSVAVICVFWAVACTFLFMDLTGKLRRYKVQPGKNDPIEIRKVVEVIDVSIMKTEINNVRTFIQALFTVVFNQTIVSITFSCGAFWISRATLGERDVKAVPSFLILMRDLLIAHHMFDIGFYTFHRLMHSKYFYKRIHKIHHEWKAPCGLIAIYAHPTGLLMIRSTYNQLINLFYRTLNYKSHPSGFWSSIMSGKLINSSNRS